MDAGGTNAKKAGNFGDGALLQNAHLEGLEMKGIGPLANAFDCDAHQMLFPFGIPEDIERVFRRWIRYSLHGGSASVLAWAWNRCVQRGRPPVELVNDLPVS